MAQTNRKRKLPPKRRTAKTVAPSRGSKKEAPSKTKATPEKVEPKATEMAEEYVEVTPESTIAVEETEETMNEIHTAEPLEEEVKEQLSTPELASMNNVGDDFDPLAEPVIQRAYTRARIKNTGNVGFEEEIPEPDYAQPFVQDYSDAPHSETGGDTSSGFGEATSFDESSDDNSAGGSNPEYDELSPAQKRKAAQKTADVILTTYANFLPVPFKKIASINIKKWERMHMADEMDMNMTVTEDGTTVRSYAEDVNRQVEDTFVITEEMKEEAREPLIDLLMEQSLALTPTQRLMLVVGQQVLTMGMATVQFAVNNKHALNQFKEFHEERKAAGFGKSSPSSSPPPNPQQKTAAPPPPAQKQEETYSAPIIEDDTQDYAEPSMSAYMDSHSDEKEILDENSPSITVEEFE